MTMNFFIIFESICASEKSLKFLIWSKFLIGSENFFGMFGAFVLLEKNTIEA